MTVKQKNTELEGKEVRAFTAPPLYFFKLIYLVYMKKGNKKMELLNETLTKIKPLDVKAMAEAVERQNQLTKPAGSLGRLEELSIQLCGIQGRCLPVLKNKAIITMAGDHAVAREGFHNWPQAVTVQMIMNIATGGAGVNALANHSGIKVIPVDMGVMSDLPTNCGIINKKVGYGVKSIIREAAMTREEAISAIEAGIQLVLDEKKQNGLDVVGTGDMGIGNTTPSSAMCSVMTGVTVEEATGRGTGINDIQLQAKIKAIKEAITLHKPDKKDAIDVLYKLGGYEIAGIAGVCLGAAVTNTMVVVDGFISTAGAMVAGMLSPQAKAYMVSAHKSVEPGHTAMLQFLGLKPVLDLDFRLGEGTGAALTINLVEAAVAVISNMRTFAEAGVDS